MYEKTRNAAELHSAGATVRHQSPFDKLESYSSDSPIDQAFINKWGIPFYMLGIHKTDEFISNYAEVKTEVSLEITKRLLGDFNWRTRIVGAYFSAIESYVELEDIIGTHLLKSEVCYAGGGYCLALASFNTENGLEYLKKYLDYYLTRKDLHFDQFEALSALNWMDKQNGTKVMDGYLPKFREWHSNQHGSNTELNFSAFDKQIKSLDRIKASK